MNAQENKARVPDIDTQKGFFNSSTIAIEPRKIFEFFQNIGNLKKVFADFPVDVENFLDLSLVSAQSGGGDSYSIKWKNKDEAKVQGSLTFLLEPAPAKRGTYLTAIGQFDNMTSKSQGSSDLLNVFLKRMKALAETGEIATTKGQPSGREELKTLH